MAISGFSPTDFMTEIETMGGLSRRWKYSVQIKPPDSLKSDVKADKIDFLALTIMMPGRTFATTDEIIYGLTKNVPYSTGYDPVLMTMLNPNDFSARIFWDDWLKHIQKPESKNAAYYKDMGGEIKISHYTDTEDTQNPSASGYSVTLHEAWPERMGPFALGWENTDWGNFEISIRYKQWSSST